MPVGMIIMISVVEEVGDHCIARIKGGSCKCG
ncbi:hypothetical protein BMS3Abin08_02415 [bacterium BMS3Abin08]|nr:hypothetical protein BMS3Abin08_02415 [bacterium BMS3Abin08]